VNSSVSAWSPDPSLLAVLEGAKRRGAIGPGPIDVHVSHALAYADVWPPLVEASGLLDLGSGGGLPGLVLAARFPLRRVILLEGRVRRAAALASVVADLGLADRVEVVAERAELAGRRADLRERFDVVVARAFGVPAVTVECGSPFVAVGGALVSSDPPGESRGDRWPSAELDLLGLAFECSSVQPVALTVLRKVGRCPERYPRRLGVPAKRPLF
jgi:16S rRNA (guanine527-N7)-methyltransferase